MNDVDSTRRPPSRGPAWIYMLGGAVVLPVLYGFLLRRGLLDVSLLNSPVRGPMIALIGVALGWLAYRIVSQPN